MSFHLQTRIGIPLMERRVLPEWMIRRGIRRLIGWQRQRRVAEVAAAGGAQAAVARFAQALCRGPVAPVPEKANEQHYEVPAAFFEEVLGDHLKYSSGYWGDDDEAVGRLRPTGSDGLTSAERRMLDLTLDGAQLQDGMRILELGCGWGSLTLAMAQRYPHARITAVSNSALQRKTIEQRADDRELRNVQVLTADMNDFTIGERFDRVVSVEMFEHMNNYHELMSRIATWLLPQGKLFVHIFSHREHAYRFETANREDWMGRYFFTGGIMPSRDLLLHFQDHLELERQWHFSGVHYQRTADAWAARMDERRERIMDIFREHYGPDSAARWFMRWKVFFWACAETFGYDNGSEWGVSHYRFERGAR